MEIQFRVRGLGGPIQGSKIGDSRLSSDPGPSASDILDIFEGRFSVSGFLFLFFYKRKRKEDIIRYNNIKKSVVHNVIHTHSFFGGGGYVQ